jgi:aspartyl-tRNA(Asn)/glutamyl-tRNA(Gln) amidotransferase subunit A
MNNSYLTQISATELGELISSKNLSPVEVTQAYLDRIDRFDTNLKAFITVCHDSAIESAKSAEQALIKGQNIGALHGLPFAVKDQFETKGLLTTAGSRVLADYIPNRDATTVSKSKNAGAILIGKLNLTQFAAGGGDHYPFGEARNPWNTEYTPGLSSSGSGIAIAASLASLTLGEDTGGSIRMPASVNGIVGLRPTWGLVSRYGVIPFCWSMDTAGPMTRTVEDAAMLLNVISGYDPMDRYTSKIPTQNYLTHLTGDIRGLRVGVIKEFINQKLVHQDVLSSVEASISDLEKLGASVEEVSLPLLSNVSIVAASISESDGAFYHRKWLLERPNDYGHNTRRRLLAGSLIPAQILHKAARVRTAFAHEWSKLFNKFDVLISPTMLSPAGKIAHVENVTEREDAIKKFGQVNSPTFPAAFIGIPALSVPCGFSNEGLPIGLQIMAKRFQDALVLKVGHALQSITDWHNKRPSM